MKLLLTSAGFTNPTIIAALAELVDNRPFNQLKLAFIPTAANVEEGDKGWLIDDLKNCQKIGFAQIDMVDISALPEQIWRDRLGDADILMFGGGNTFHLMYWLEKSGLNKLLPYLLQTRVYVGISAGSMVTAPSLKASQSTKLYYPDSSTPIIEQALGLVNFHIRPHLNSPYFPNVTLSFLEHLTQELSEGLYAIDDASAITVVDDQVEVVSEGEWRKF